MPDGWPAVMTDGLTPERAAAEWFIALRESPDDPELRARFAQWRDADPRHAGAWSELGETARIIATAPAERRTYELPSVTARRSARRRGALGPGRRWRQAAVAAAAACVAVIAAPTLSLRLAADHVSGTGEVETITLADGSTAQLGPDSAIAVDFGPRGREIRLLSGQAMFEVRRDPARPFRVAARDVTTTVLGTGFEVRMVGELTRVAVRHGRVRVEDSGTKPFAARELTAGQWVRIVPGAPLSAGQEAPELVGAWRSGKVAVRNRPISEAIDEMRPWYGGKIILADSSLGKKLVSGAYDFRDPARSLKLIVAPYGGDVMRVTPWLMIVTR